MSILYKHFLNYCGGLLLVASLIASFSSCKKYLDKKANLKQVVPTSLSDIQALMDDATNMNGQIAPSAGDAACDDYFVTNEIYNSLNGFYDEFYFWKWHPVEYGLVNDWYNGYYLVYPSNYSLEILKTLPRTASNAAAWDNVKGTAQFFRSFTYLSLALVYANLYDESTYEKDYGVALRVTSDFNVGNVRSTVKETYDFIIKDLKEALGLLPDLPVHPYRPSRASASALLARAYLSMRKYDSAYKYANMSLGLNSRLMNYNDPTKVAVSSASPFKAFNEEILFHIGRNGTYVFGSTRMLVDTVLYNSYAANDLRKKAFFLQSGSYFRMKGTYFGGSAPAFAGLAVDETLLMRAECHARLGRTSEAMADLNTLLKTRWVTNTYTDQTAANSAEALRIIKEERRKELIFRSVRWMDLKRYNKEGDNIVLKRILNGTTYTLAPSSKYYAIPLPDDLIKVTGMPQNPFD